jgi:integrase
LRAGELLALRWKDVDLLSKRISIRHSLWRRQIFEPKTEESIRDLMMPDVLVQILMKHHSGSQFTAPDDFVFCQADGRPTDPDSLRRLGIYPALERAGVTFKKRASGCHAFRHLAASIIHKETGSLKLAQTQLGHSTISTTSDIYTHVEEEELERTASVLGQALAPNVVEMLYETENSTETIQ